MIIRRSIFLCVFLFSVHIFAADATVESVDLKKPLFGDIWAQTWGTQVPSSGGSLEERIFTMFGDGTGRDPDKRAPGKSTSSGMLPGDFAFYSTESYKQTTTSPINKYVFYKAPNCTNLKGPWAPEEFLANNCPLGFWEGFLEDFCKENGGCTKEYELAEFTPVGLARWNPVTNPKGGNCETKMEPQGGCVASVDLISPPNWTGETIDDACWRDKPSSILAIENSSATDIILGAFHHPAAMPLEGTLAYSLDGGETWKKSTKLSPWRIGQNPKVHGSTASLPPSFPKSKAENFRVLMFLQGGKSYSKRPADPYVYAFAIGEEVHVDGVDYNDRYFCKKLMKNMSKVSPQPQKVYLARIGLKSVVDYYIDYAQWEYYKGGTGTLWSSNIEDATFLVDSAGAPIYISAQSSAFYVDEMAAASFPGFFLFTGAAPDVSFPRKARIFSATNIEGPYTPIEFSLPTAPGSYCPPPFNANNGCSPGGGIVGVNPKSVGWDLTNKELTFDMSFAGGENQGYVLNFAKIKVKF